MEDPSDFVNEKSVVALETACNAVLQLVADKKEESREWARRLGASLTDKLSVAFDSGDGVGASLVKLISSLRKEAARDV